MPWSFHRALPGALPFPLSSLLLLLGQSLPWKKNTFLLLDAISWKKYSSQKLNREVLSTVQSSFLIDYGFSNAFQGKSGKFFFLTGPLAFRKVLPYGLWKKFKKPQNAFGILCCETKLTLNYLFLTWPPFKWKKTCHMIGKFFFLGNLDPVTSKYGGIV